MLTHTDVHYLTGLLQVVTSPNPVQVELGSMVRDDAAGTDRDVDVTVSCQPDDTAPRLLVGIEVKDHDRPLDITHVEQLAAKLGDMSVLGKRGIVSASGYTSSAIRKAGSRGVELYTMERWNPKDDVFATSFAALTSLPERTLRWANATICFNPDQRANPDLQRALESNCSLVGEDGMALTDLPDRVSLVGLVARQTLGEIQKSTAVSVLPAGTRVPQTWDIELGDRPCVALSAGREVLTSARISGDVCWDEERHDLEFRRIVSVTEGMKPIAGCGLAEMANGDLMGLTTSNFGNQGKLSVICISAADRRKAVIRRQPLRSRDGGHSR